MTVKVSTAMTLFAPSAGCNMLKNKVTFRERQELFPHIRSIYIASQSAAHKGKNTELPIIYITYREKQVTGSNQAIAYNNYQRIMFFSVHCCCCCYILHILSFWN
jgi:hypothetical protein